jgi:predicted nucleic acid-binding protein
VVYAELAASFESPRELDDTLSELVRLAIPWEAAFLAGQAFASYRARGGARERMLPDFLIGAHAQVTGMRLLTRDARRYRGSFDALELIAPGPGLP